MAQLVEAHGFPTRLALDADMGGEFFGLGFDADPLFAIELATRLLEFDLVGRLIRLPFRFVEGIALRVGHQEPATKGVVEDDVAGRVDFDADGGRGRFFALEPQRGAVL